MITKIVGDALDVTDGIIVHGCNCQGVMGAGIAFAIRKRYPEAYLAYKAQADGIGLYLGEIIVVEVEPRKWIINAMTQDTTGSGKQVSYDAIDSCFKQVNQVAQILEQSGIKQKVIFPMIGAGLGGGNWNVIEKIIDEAVSDEFQKLLYVLP